MDAALERVLMKMLIDIWIIYPFKHAVSIKAESRAKKHWFALKYSIIT